MTKRELNVVLMILNARDFLVDYLDFDNNNDCQLFHYW